nr:AIR synthase-related protein [Candidatus Sigynarchaeota archaeon]
FKKHLDNEQLANLASLMLEEVKKSRVKPQKDTILDLLSLNKVDLSIGQQGVGCRGAGDFIVHELVTKMASTEIEAFLSPSALDDAGAVVLKGDSEPRYVVTKMEGMHSRLSNFPFIAAFHVTRACLRDLYVKGALPISIMVDIHLGDDCDVAKLFDFMAGVAAVSELARVPITAGSTLRIGGDMVIGDRITGGIAAVGVCSKLLARRDIKQDSDIIMTEGAGGGTIATTAIYNGKPDIVSHTLNVTFLRAMQLILDRKDLLENIYCCSDVTNGGLRGDLFEILKDSRLGAELEENAIRNLVNPAVLDLLDVTNTDYLGVSLDALLVFCNPDVTQRIISTLESAGIKASRIGFCKSQSGVHMKTLGLDTIPLVP